jgi:hypothetical protein
MIQEMGSERADPSVAHHEVGGIGGCVAEELEHQRKDVLMPQRDDAGSPLADEIEQRSTPLVAHAPAQPPFPHPCDPEEQGEEEPLLVGHPVPNLAHPGRFPPAV